jgi:hypothetical protein
VSTDVRSSPTRHGPNNSISTDAGFTSACTGRNEQHETQDIKGTSLKHTRNRDNHKSARSKSPHPPPPSEPPGERKIISSRARYSAFLFYDQSLSLRPSRNVRNALASGPWQRNCVFVVVAANPILLAAAVFNDDFAHRKCHSVSVAAVLKKSARFLSRLDWILFKCRMSVLARGVAARQ